MRTRPRLARIKQPGRGGSRSASSAIPTSVRACRSLALRGSNRAVNSGPGATRSGASRIKVPRSIWPATTASGATTAPSPDKAASSSIKLCSNVSIAEISERPSPAAASQSSSSPGRVSLSRNLILRRSQWLSYSRRGQQAQRITKQRNCGEVRRKSSVPAADGKVPCQLPPVFRRVGRAHTGLQCSPRSLQIGQARGISQCIANVAGAMI